jgi:uncharacterized protein (UPF0332 family)
MSWSRRLPKVDIRVKDYLDRAENQILLAKANFRLSTSDDAKEVLNIPPESTFFNNVISESYYAIFYSAKAFLLASGTKTEAPEEHRKTYEEFKKIVESRRLDRQLAEIYEEESGKAEKLLRIFFNEKRDRGRFTYNVNANANKPFAEASIKNAVYFVRIIKHIIETKK